MERADSSCDQAGLLQVRTRCAQFSAYLFWALYGGFLLVLAGFYASLVSRGLALLEQTRLALGFHVPASRPDWLIISGVLVSVAVPAMAGLCAWRWYRSRWNHRLEAVWPNRQDRRRYAPVQRLPLLADPSRLAQKSEYLGCLLNSPRWRTAAGDPAPVPTTAKEYEIAASGLLRAIESDVCERAAATGLIVGVSRAPLIDAVTIAAASLEMQMHVLARLGKRPSFGTWIELWKRTGASLFVNTYLNREDTWALRLAIQKTAMGLELAGELVEHATESLEDVDWHEILDELALSDNWAAELAKSGVQAILGGSALVVGIGAAGIQQIARLIDRCGDEIVQGVLAGSVLYYHGMAIAADCLALDENHRRSTEMTRTFSQAAQAMVTFAGGLLRTQVREFRAALAQRRSLAIRVLRKKAATAAVEKSRAGWESVKTKTKEAAATTAAVSSKAADSIATGAKKAASATAQGLTSIKTRLTTRTSVESPPEEASDDRAQDRSRD